MTAISTISALLTLSNSQYRVYDIGRKIDKISKDEFKKIELNQIPYPFPSQGHAFIALTFWQKQSLQPYLWFIKLPLDERGLINLVARDHFIAIIIEALGKDLTVTPTEQQESLLKNNPYHFTPSQYKLAALNSKIKFTLKQEPSEFLNTAKQYLSGDLGWQNWQKIGVQGLTDFAAAINQDNHSDMLSKALTTIAPEVLLPLCAALENEPLPVTLIDCILDKLQAAFVNNNLELQQHLLRSLASSCHHQHVSNFITKLLAQQQLSDEVLITLAGRCWLLWQQQTLLMSYLEQVVNHGDAPLFNAIFKDLVAIPKIRAVLFQCMRDPNRSTALAQAIGLLFNPSSH